MKSFRLNVFTVLFTALTLGISATAALPIVELPNSANNIEIINGEPVLKTNPLASSVVGLLVKFTSQLNPGQPGIWIQSCTGSVLNSRMILTAAHCVDEKAASSIAINFSLNTVTFDQQRNPSTRITDIEKHFVVRKVKSYIVHPAYDGSGENDLAVIALTEDAPATATPVTLLPSKYLDLTKKQTTFEGESKPVTLMGFGLVNEHTQQDTDVLRQTTVQARFENNLVITDQTKGSGGCNGDSGGPAFLKLDGKTYQVGVTHGPHPGSTTCAEEGEWVNPALDPNFLNSAIDKLK